MKRLVVFAAIILSASLTALAQGTVNWSGPSPAAVTVQTNSTQYSIFQGGGPTPFSTIGSVASITSGTQFYFSLLYQAFTGVQAPQPTTLAQLSAWTDTGLGGQNSTVAGRLAVFNPNPAQVIPWANGTTDSVMLVIWSADLGSTFASALSSLQLENFIGIGYIGETATGYINPSTSTISGATLFNNSDQGSAGLPIGNSLNTQLFEVVVSPEPGTIALTAMGALSVLAIRRRKGS